MASEWSQYSWNCSRKVRRENKHNRWCLLKHNFLYSQSFFRLSFIFFIFCSFSVWGVWQSNILSLHWVSLTSIFCTPQIQYKKITKISLCFNWIFLVKLQNKMLLCCILFFQSNFMRHIISEQFFYRHSNKKKILKKPTFWIWTRLIRSVMFLAFQFQLLDWNTINPCRSLKLLPDFSPYSWGTRPMAVDI